MKLLIKNNIYRNCFSRGKENCVFASRNEFGTECCTIDRIVQTKFYGCIPQEVINKKDQEYQEEEVYLNKMKK